MCQPTSPDQHLLSVYASVSYSVVRPRRMITPAGTWPVRDLSAWAERASDAEVNRVVEYKSILDGQLARTPAWQIVLHVVNHATLHRGQVMGMLRQIGIDPRTPTL